MINSLAVLLFLAYLSNLIIYWTLKSFSNNRFLKSWPSPIYLLLLFTLLPKILKKVTATIYHQISIFINYLSIIFELKFFTNLTNECKNCSKFFFLFLSQEFHCSKFSSEIFFLKIYSSKKSKSCTVSFETNHKNHFPRIFSILLSFAF